MKNILYLIKSLIIVIAVLLFCILISIEANAQVIETIVYESSSESLEGQIAVASVIKTRMVERNKSAVEIVLQRKQFSCWKNGKPTQSRRIKEEERTMAEQAWDMAEAGKYNHYARYDCKPYWAKSAKSSVRIGNHIFYEI